MLFEVSRQSENLFAKIALDILRSFEVKVPKMPPGRARMLKSPEADLTLVHSFIGLILNPKLKAA